MSDLQGNPSRPVSASEFTQEETYRASRLPVDRASTLIPDAYTSPEFHALELDRIFGTSWVPYASRTRSPSRELRRRRRRRTLADRLPKPLWRAACPPQRLSPPRNEALRDGARDRRTLLSVPVSRLGVRSGRRASRDAVVHAGSGNPGRPGGRLRHVGRARVRQGGLRPPSRTRRLLGLPRVRLPRPEAPPLLDELRRPAGAAGRPPPRGVHAAPAGRVFDRGQLEARRRELHGYYHLPWVHPGLVKVSPLKSHYRWQGSGMYMGFCTTPIAANTDDGGWLGLPALSTLSEEDRESARFAWLFPNLALNALPNHTFLMLARPTEAGRTERPRTCFPIRSRSPARATDSRTRWRPDPLLGRGQPRGHRDRRTRAARGCRHRLYGRENVLPLRGVSPSVPEHGHRPDGRGAPRSCW